MNLVRLSLLAAAATLAACASAAPYQPLSKGIGYSEQQLESNRYRVSFAGNGATPKATVENYMLYRAAEVTLQRGYDGFLITNREVQLAPQSGGGNFGFSFGGIGVGRGGGIGIGAGTQARGAEEYTAGADILMFRGAKPPNDNNAYNARELISNLEDKVHPPAKTG